MIKVMHFLLCWLSLIEWMPAAEALNPPDRLLAIPSFVRVELPEATARSTIHITLRLRSAATVQAIETDCQCISTEFPTQRELVAGDHDLPITVTGLLPSIKQLTCRTTAGSATITIQVVTPGLGQGAALATRAVEQARAGDLRLIAVVNNLRGETRNCGCSGGSLGGMDHLAGLSDALPGARLVLTGDIDGEVSGSGGPLEGFGWERHPKDIVESTDPLHDLGRTDLTAIIQAGGPAIAHQRIIRPLLDRGAIAHLLFLNQGGTVVDQKILPIDRTLPSHRVQSTPGTPVPSLRPRVTEETGCSGCHQQAHAAWEVTAHARALSSLTPADRSTACVTCHTTPSTGTRERLADVTCIGCHQEATSHARQPQETRAGRAVDCRTCHDAQHHPAFDPISAWIRIQHGK